MGFISEIFGYLLDWLYNVFNNYGIAIFDFFCYFKSNLNTDYN